ncbi:lysine--tRNA ligase [Yanshouia hominis]|uniref:Lysine--tRNA ligase n=1 Tax=Yanshouia hominis TaxID=2763673 RepID=A0ABR7NJ81_9FIRM|nr:lysine--tRNA ligase [Yanshouia hominis]MBC8576469.1 lysine--tRNA ligase [Yanshouia hominis]
MSEQQLSGVDQSTPEQTQQDLSELARIRREKLDSLRAEGKNPFEITKYERTSCAREIAGRFDEMENQTVRIAGRIMTWRNMGKASFIDLRDASGRMQIYIRINDVGEEAYAAFNTWDIGDIIGVEGFVFRTRKGEISVHAKEIRLLSKALLPLPDKWHGLKDTELRYRQRYVDLITSPEVKETFVKRSQIIREIRSFLDGRGYLEVETPVLHAIAGGAAAKPFITHHNALDIDMYMRIALELHLKRLIVGGFDKVYEIGRVFRNEGIDTRHNPEFTLLELYEAYTDLYGVMDLVEDLFHTVCAKVLGTGKISYGGVELNLDKPFERITMTEIVKRYSGVDFSEITTVEQARAAAKEHHVEIEERFGIGKILEAFFDEFAEKNIIQPTFVTEYPVEISPLAKRMPEKPDYTERFELFIIGREYANAFSELNDPIDQRGRFEEQARQKALGDDEACDVDEDYLTAMEYGMPPTGGLGIGVDRFVMLLTDSASIRDVLLFPTMRPMPSRTE